MFAHIAPGKSLADELIAAGALLAGGVRWLAHGAAFDPHARSGLERLYRTSRLLRSQGLRTPAGSKDSKVSSVSK
jgi:hypothetical protein